MADGHPRARTIDQVMEIPKKTGVRFGIMVNPGGAVSDDAGLRRFIDSLKLYPVYYGLQPMSPGWSGSFSPETIKLLDYVLMDSQTIPNGNRYGETPIRVRIAFCSFASEADFMRSQITAFQTSPVLRSTA
jgi:hypothetical protein